MSLLKTLDELERLSRESVSLNESTLAMYVPSLLTITRKMREALEFYADIENWTPSNSGEKHQAYTNIWDDSTMCDDLIGGRRARTCLKELGLE